MDHSDNDCLAVIILSHGELVPYHDSKSDKDIDTILSLDLISYVHSKDTLYPLQMIWSYFTDENCPTLKNKPRLFFVQACQGAKADPGITVIAKRRSEIEFPASRTTQNDHDTGGKPFASFEVKPILPLPHFITAFSSLNGFVSFRNEKRGSWFIQSLCKMLDEREDDQDLNNILTATKRAVAYEFQSNSYEPGLDQRKQQSYVVSSLYKLLVFPRTQVANGY